MVITEPLPPRTTPAQTYTTLPKASPSGIDPDPTSASHDTVDNCGKLTLRNASRLHHLGIGRSHAGTKVLILIIATTAAIDDGIAPRRNFARLRVVERQSSRTDDDDARLCFARTTAWPRLGLIFRPCQATRCRNGSLKWRKHSTSALTNWRFCLPARSPAVRGGR